MNANGRNMYVFRDGRCPVSGSTLVKALAAALQRISFVHSSSTEARNLLIDALLRAGELECALIDAGSLEAERLAQLTDVLATLLVGSSCSRLAPADLVALLPRAVPDVLHLSPPEGFAFYALHPLDFADLAERALLRGHDAAVVGIRSIGATLSAVVTAALLKRGLRASRVTVRPTGHPYDRRTEFDSEQLRWIADRRAREADFLVVDEGPGMSGSSFLSVGEALLSAGVARSRIQFLCSRQPDVNALCARDAASRWQSFHGAYAAPATHLPPGAKIYIGGGYWRHELVGYDPALWPASWSQMERLKFLSPDRRTLFKFEGFGRFGAEIHQRARLLSEAGYAAPPTVSNDGFGVYPFIAGDILMRSDLSADVLERMAAYCAFRAREFRAHASADSQQIETMLRFNVSEEFGIELNGDLDPLQTGLPILVDGRMLPHEWVRSRDGHLMKCDASSHGDDHFFPGPATDICWDLAGAMVEWDMPAAAREFFIRRYRALGGDDPRRRLPVFLLAYAVFRMAYCKMAAAAMHDSEEESRLLNAYGYYCDRAAALLPQNAPLIAAD